MTCSTENPVAWSDTVLVACYLEGDDGTAMTVLFARHNAQLVAFCRSCLHLDADAAKDIAQDTWEKVLSRTDLRADGSFVGLLYQTARYRHLTLWQKERTAKKFEGALQQLDGKPVGARPLCKYCSANAPYADGLCPTHHKRRLAGWTETRMREPVNHKYAPRK